MMREIGPDHFVACHFPLEPARWDDKLTERVDSAQPDR
jgi:hypothetical protein